MNSTTSDAGRAVQLLRQARADLQRSVEIRRALHRHPEVGLDVPFAQRTVVTELETLGLELRTGRSLTSVVAYLRGALPGPTIVLRADMDALPIRENTELSFASEVEGLMHACGHDAHVAMLLSAARILTRRAHQISGTVVLMFQPGEEGFHGARHMLEEGLLDGFDLSDTVAFALHIHTRFPTGTVYLRSGQTMAAPDMFEIRVHGRGGHASTPHAAIDPIPVVAEIIMALQAMVTRRIDVFDPAVVTVGQIAAGTTHNVIPDVGLIRGTIRTLTADTRSAVHRHIRQLAEGIAAAHGATAEVDVEWGYPSTVNDPRITELVRGAAENLIGIEAVRTLDHPLMGGEDFAYVLERVPGVLAFLGARPAGREGDDSPPMNHSGDVIFDEPSMAIGAALYAEVALSGLVSGKDERERH